jgi:hypothetical protein
MKTRPDGMVCTPLKNLFRDRLVRCLGVSVGALQGVPPLYQGNNAGISFYQVMYSGGPEAGYLGTQLSGVHLLQVGRDPGGLALPAFVRQVEYFGPGIGYHTGQLLAGIVQLGAGVPELDDLGPALPPPLAGKLLPLGVQASTALGMAAHVNALLDPSPRQVGITHPLPTPAQFLEFCSTLGFG